MTDKIRNIIQSHSEREIIKTAPDIVAYIEGRPYIINKYVNSGDLSYTSVTFNDFVDSFSASYDIDNLIPSGSISLTVPNNLKRLFQVPAGAANILEPMMEVQVFSKGYFPSIRGNTLYYRVFKGLISNVSYTDTGTVLQIHIGIVGTLRLLETMQVDIAPAIISMAPLSYTTVLRNNQACLDPYKQLADMFLRSVTTAGFQMNSLNQATLAQGQQNSSDWADAIHEGYILRWQAKLVNLVRDVRILGYDMKNAPIAKEEDLEQIPDVLSHADADAFGHMDPDLAAARSSRLANDSPTTTRNDSNMYVNIVRKYLPDMAVGSLNLLNGSITSRLERLRSVTNLIMYEAYQDLDGAIIFKPPLYNLDVTNSNIGTNDPNSPNRSLANYITPQTNPFIVYLSEIQSETETEDEHAVRTTRMTMSGNWLVDFQLNTEMMKKLSGVVDYIDIAKLSKFGVREEPVRQLPFIKSQDTKFLYAYAASETARANRGYRTYSVTIPLRPEIRLGFPMYFPHKDMYGYIKTISISYQQGQGATMQITTDTVRKRILVPSTTSVNGKSVTSFTSQPNLVMQWTKPANDQPQSIAQAWTSQQLTGASSGMTQGGNPSTNDSTNPIGNHPTQRTPQNAPFSQDEWAYIKDLRESVGSMWSSRFDTKDSCYRVQNDNTTVDDEHIKDDNGAPQPTGIKQGTKFFDSSYWKSGINWVYYYKILNTQPYTDEKGYEVVSPFPWGRWVSITDAIRETRLGILTPSSGGALSADQISGVQTFLFAGAAPDDPTITSQFSTSQLNNLLPSTPGTSEAGREISHLYDTVELDSVIELDTPEFNYPGTDKSLTDNLQPDMKDQVKNQTADLNAIRSSLGVFLTGGASSPNVQVIKQADNTSPTESAFSAAPVPSLPKFVNPLKGGNG